MFSLHNGAVARNNAIEKEPSRDGYNTEQYALFGWRGKEDVCFKVIIILLYIVCILRAERLFFLISNLTARE